MTYLDHRPGRARARRGASGLALALAWAAACSGGSQTSDSLTQSSSDTEPTSTTETGQTSDTDATSDATTVGPTTDPSTDPTTGPGTDPTTSTTTPAVCGNGVLEDGEQCDDGNDVPDDGCESDCTLSPGAAYWTRSHDESGGLDEGMGVAVDGVGNVYVVANVDDDLNQQDVWIRKYDPTGVSLWTQQYDGGAGSIDSVAAVTSDGAGFMTAVGRMSTDGMGSDFWLSRCDPQGQLLWQFTDPAAIFGGDIATLAGGEFVVAGSIKQGDDNAFVRRYDSSGAELWTRVYEGPADGPDTASAVAVDGAGRILVAGREFTQDQGFNIWFARYQPDGLLDFTDTEDGPSSGTDWANGVAVDPQTDEFVLAGRVDGAGGSVDVWFARYSEAGAQLWSNVHDEAGGTDFASDVGVDSGGNIVLAGQSEEDGQDDIWVGKYSAAGDELWIDVYGGESHEEDIARAVAVDPFDDIIIVGHETLVASFDSDVWIRKREP